MRWRRVRGYGILEPDVGVSDEADVVELEDRVCSLRASRWLRGRLARGGRAWRVRSVNWRKRVAV